MSGKTFPVPDLVRRRAVSEGSEGLAWLSSLDSTLASLEHDWNLTIGPPLDGGSAAFVAEARTSRGESVVVKVSTPATAAHRHEVDVLHAAAGKGYVTLLRHHAPRRAMLLEHLGARLETSGLSYEHQVNIVCATLLEAWMLVPAGMTFPTGADKANALGSDIVRLWNETGQPCSSALIDKALLYCRDRAASYRREHAVLAHGDPHPANILAVPGKDRFKFIDPDGIAIEPAYDLGVLLRAWDEGVGGRHAHDIARSHARHLATRTQVSAEAIWQWGFIERVSTGLLLLQLGEHASARQFLAIAETLLG
ncbi:streptomycin 6-kinase [Devosia sp. UYZn731]|uniref:aminoglycoside phosphotransferase family protein n=1 Tax=Devosia sp. UYZn731 TaxID=3156345 RepID=UPI003397DD16